MKRKFNLNLALDLKTFLLLSISKPAFNRGVLKRCSQHQLFETTNIKNRGYQPKGQEQFCGCLKIKTFPSVSNKCSL